MWFAYSLFFAIWTSFSMLIAKKLIKGISPVLFLLLTLLFSLPFLIILLFISGVPKFSPDFFFILFIAGIFDTTAAILYYKALSISEVSLLAPISSVNPVFVLFFATIFLQENPTPLKLFGIVIIVIGLGKMSCGAGSRFARGRLK